MATNNSRVREFSGSLNTCVPWHVVNTREGGATEQSVCFHPILARLFHLMENANTKLTRAKLKTSRSAFLLVQRSCLLFTEDSEIHEMITFYASKKNSLFFPVQLMFEVSLNPKERNSLFLTTNISSISTHFTGSE